MSALWSRALELLGRLRLSLSVRKTLRVGHPRAPDAQGGGGWLRFLVAERLFDVWGPVPASPWVPFHCVPLFAALDHIKREDIGPTPPVEEPAGALSPPVASAAPTPGAPMLAAPMPGAPSPVMDKVTPAWSMRPVLPTHARPGAPAPQWADLHTWTILDLPGPRAVEAGAWLVTAAGCQPVCTFDNWPHPKGVLRAEETLAELLRWATTVEDARAPLRDVSPPVWICDSERLGIRSGQPGEFDNRYYLDDSILPGPALLARAGIARVVYVTLENPDPPVLDLEAYFADLLAANIPVLHVDLAAADQEPRALSAPASPRKPPREGFRRSAAGGFGTEVPEPSSSGG